MPFTTAEQVRTAIDDAELAIHGAIQDGTIITVLGAMKEKIVSSFLSAFLTYLLRTIQSGRPFPCEEEWAFRCRIQSQAVPLRVLHSIYTGTEGRNPQSDVCGKSTKGTEWFPGDGGEDKDRQGEGEGDGRRREGITSGTPKGKGTAARGRALTNTTNVAASQEQSEDGAAGIGC